MKISFIIPALNEQENIFLCVEGIQDSCNWYIRSIDRNFTYEIIVVDNGSTDKTIENARAAYANTIITCPEKGLVKARQAGYEIAKGEFVAFIDADNRMTPDGWIPTALSHFEDPDVVAVSGSLQFYDYPELNTSAKYFYKIAKALHPIWPTLQGGNFLIRKTALDQLNGFDTSIPFWGEDTATAVSLAKLGKIVLDETLVINTSGRRFKQDGLAKTVGLYILNYFAVNLFNNPITKKYEDFR